MCIRDRVSTQSTGNQNRNKHKPSSFFFYFPFCLSLYATLLQLRLLAKMPSGNGCRAQQKRERNAAKAGGAAKSQLKVNEKAKSILCKVCRQSFLCTTTPAELKQHAENKHPKNPYDSCFDA
eukprot:TRINITY_DN542_c0_g1_i1.p1 TRINITY_DN542_c0_g1~~TRINITY_DN542_c0_g1_i1.p1  ORF type:complete len:122 (-),score=18.89 TRINITY_DN542_c0_g1_i1:147-512(-)